MSSKSSSLSCAWWHARVFIHMAMGGGLFPKLVWPKHNMVNQQVKVGVANDD